jgi:hypothetical protein
MPSVQEEASTPQEHPATGTPGNARILFDVLQRQDGSDMVDRAAREAMVEIYKADPPPTQSMDNGFFVQQLLSCQRVFLPDNGDLKRYLEEKNIIPWRLTVDITFTQTDNQVVTDSQLTDGLYAVFETLWPLGDYCLFGLHPRISPALSHAHYNNVRVMLNKAFARGRGKGHPVGTLMGDRDGIWGWGMDWDFVTFMDSVSPSAVVQTTSDDASTWRRIGRSVLI